jgi:hypothetical protein
MRGGLRLRARLPEQEKEVCGRGGYGREHRKGALLKRGEAAVELHLVAG